MRRADHPIIKRAVAPEKIKKPFATARIVEGRQLSCATLSCPKTTSEVFKSTFLKQLGSIPNMIYFTPKLR